MATKEFFPLLWRCLRPINPPFGISRQCAGRNEIPARARADYFPGDVAPADVQAWRGMRTGTLLRQAIAAPDEVCAPALPRRLVAIFCSLGPLLGAVRH